MSRLGRNKLETNTMRHRPATLRRPAPAQSFQGIIGALLQIVTVFQAIYEMLAGLFGGASA